MSNIYQNGFVHSAILVVGVILLVLVAAAVLTFGAPQGIVHADDIEPDYSSWSSDCCYDSYIEPDYSSWASDCCDDSYIEPDYSSWESDCCNDPYYSENYGCEWDCYSGDYGDGCYDYCGGDYGDDYGYGDCYDYCGDSDYDGCFDYCGDDYDYDGCDYECDDFYDFDEYDDFDDDGFYEEDEFYRDSHGARYSNSGSASRFSSPSFSSAPMRFSNMPNYPVNYPRQSPVFIPNQPIQGHPVSNTSITNVDNSINGSFNDYSINDSFNVSDNSINNSFNTAIAQGGGDTVTSVAAVTPGYTVAYTLPSYSQPTYTPRAPIFPASSQYVALSQIPYTGFDLGPVGNAMYWMSLMSIAAMGAYFLLYFKGGALALAGGFARGFRTPATRTREIQEELPVLSVAPIAKKEATVGNTKDTMTISEKGIVINRSY